MHHDKPTMHKLPPKNDTHKAATQTFATDWSMCCKTFFWFTASLVAAATSSNENVKSNGSLAFNLSFASASIVDKAAKMDVLCFLKMMTGTL